MLYIIIWLIFPWLSAKVAEDKGRDFVTWFIIGLFLGPIALLIVFILDPISDTFINNGSKKKCPFCAELINSEAIKCKHCGEKQSGKKPENMNEKELNDLINKIQNNKNTHE